MVHGDRSRRCGFFLLDVAVGFVLVLVALVVLIQIVFQLSDHRSLLRQRQIAVDTLQNVAEILGESTVTNETLDSIVAESLPDGQLQLEILPQDNATEFIQLRITVSYDEGKSRPRRELSLIRILPAPEATP